MGPFRILLRVRYIVAVEVGLANALCLSCGGDKHGALVACDHCGFSPGNAWEQARHLLVAERIEAGADIASLREELQRGELRFDDDLLAERVEELDEVHPWGLALFALVVVAGPVLMGALLLLVLVVLLF